MTVFAKKYAHIYDSLYKEKDYEKECNFIEDIFKQHSMNVKSILDLGCGTGGHAIILAQRGYNVSGIDRSADMLRTAKEKSRNAGVKIQYLHSTIQGLNLKKKFDAVISMFAVMSYQTDNNDLASACKTARAHLKNSGIFIFDAWHGLAVMTDPPTDRIKEVGGKSGRIIRITKPHVNILAHTVDTNFKVLTFKKDSLISEIDETHTMRFLFPQEIKYFLEVAGFSDVRFCPFLGLGDQLSVNDWNMTVIAQ